MNRIEEFISKYDKLIKELGQNYPDQKSLVLDFQDLERFDPAVADRLRKNPIESLADFNEILNNLGILTVVENPRFYVRFRNMPRISFRKCDWLNYPSIIHKLFISGDTPQHGR